MKEGKEDVVVIEKQPFSGGIWVTSGNVESRVQVDPISFRPIEDESDIRKMSDSDPFDTMAPTRGEVLGRLAKDVADLQERILYNLTVVAFEHDADCGTVRTTLRDSETQEEFECSFKQLHIRTGCLDRPSKCRFLNQKAFRGKICSGSGNDIALEDLKDQNVVVIGLGAFAIENVRRCLLAGAKKVTLLSRSFNKPLFPEYCTYLLRSGLQELDHRQEEDMRVLWRKVHQNLVLIAKTCNLTEVALNKNTTRVVDGEVAIVFNGGVPPMSCNCVYLANAYGMMDIRKGEVDKVRAF